MQGAQLLDSASTSVPAQRQLPIPHVPQRSLHKSKTKLTLWRSLLDAAHSAFEARRLFVLLPFAAIAGQIFYVLLPYEPHPAALIGVALVLAAVMLGASRSTLALRCTVLALAFWAGAGLLPLHGAFFGTTMLRNPVYGVFTARVDEVLSATDEARRIVVSELVPVGHTRQPDIVKARLFVPGEPPLAPGDRIEANMRLAQVPGPVLPGSYDGQFHSYFSGIGAYGNANGALTVVAEGSNYDPTRAVESVRGTIGNRIDAVLGGASSAIGRAMVMGDQSDIDDETRKVMAASGLAHIYSISGLHLSIVAGGVFWLVRMFLSALPWAGSWPVKKWAAVVGLLAATGYLLLAGGVNNVPALRSTIMLGLIFGAVLAGRRALTMRNVAIAAIAIIIIDPASVFRASFQLSFAAVVALLGIYEMPRKGGAKNAGRLARLWAVVWGTAYTSFIAGTATVIFSAYHFQQTAPLGVIGNVLVLPVVSLVIMPFGVLAVLAMPLGLDVPFVEIMGWGIDRMVDVAVLVAGWSEGLTGNPLLTATALVIALAALAWFAFFNGRWRFLGPVVSLPLIFLIGFEQRPDLLIADTTQAIALRTDAGMGLVTGRPGSFAVNAWSNHYQQEIAATPDEVHCDSLGCIARMPAFSVAVVKSPAAFADDCAVSDLVIARFRVPKTCGAPQIIDAARLRDTGVQWLRWNAGAGRFDIRPAIPNLNRPWRVAPR